MRSLFKTTKQVDNTVSKHLNRCYISHHVTATISIFSAWFCGQPSITQLDAAHMAAEEVFSCHPPPLLYLLTVASVEGFIRTR